MSTSLTVTRPFHIRQGTRGRQELRLGKERPTEASGRVPRVARLLALATRFDQLLRDGLVADQAELARLGHVTRARLTQIMNLLSLAPDLQEAILFLPETQHGHDPIAEHDLRPIAAELDWDVQRAMWRRLRGTAKAAADGPSDAPAPRQSPAGSR